MLTYLMINSNGTQRTARLFWMGNSASVIYVQGISSLWTISTSPLPQNLDLATVCLTKSVSANHRCFTEADTILCSIISLASLQPHLQQEENKHCQYAARMDYVTPCIKRWLSQLSQRKLLHPRTWTQNYTKALLYSVTSRKGQCL